MEGRRGRVFETEASRDVDWKKKKREREREEESEGHGKGDLIRVAVAGWSVRRRQSNVSGGSGGCG